MVRDGLMLNEGRAKVESKWQNNVAGEAQESYLHRLGNRYDSPVFHNMRSTDIRITSLVLDYPLLYLIAPVYSRPL